MTMFLRLGSSGDGGKSWCLPADGWPNNKKERNNCFYYVNREKKCSGTGSGRIVLYGPTCRRADRTGCRS